MKPAVPVAGRQVRRIRREDGVRLIWLRRVYRRSGRHGIDLVIRTRSGQHFDVQVKSFRLEAGKSTPYVFVQKHKFEVSPSLLLALVQFVDAEPPTLYLVPSCLGDVPNPVLESRDYGNGRVSLPEWGLTLSKKKLALLAQEWSFHSVVAALL